LTVDLSANLESDLLDRSIDLAFQSGPFSQPMSGERDLGVFPMIWIAAPQTELHALDQVKIDDIMQYPILTHSRNTQPYREVAAHFSNRRNLKARLVPSSNLSACIHMTIEGFGVAAVPAAMVVDELQSGELVQINYAWAPRALQFSARYDADRAPQYVAAAAEIAAEISHEFALSFAANSGITTHSKDNK
jgi:DNA-binding transcriptional LysR family regulator